MGMPRERLVLIHWLDIVREPGPWMSRLDAAQLKPVDCYSVGFVIYDDNERIVLSDTLGPTREDDIGACDVIPRCVVQEIYDLCCPIAGEGKS